MNVTVRQNARADERRRRRHVPAGWPGHGAALLGGRGASILSATASVRPAAARYGAGLTVEESSTNLIPNPRIANGSNGYLKTYGTETSLTVVTGDGPIGHLQFLRVVTTTANIGEGVFYGGGGQLGVASGVTYTFSIWVRGTGVVQPRIHFSTGGGGATGMSVVLSSSWVRLRVSATAAATTTARAFIETTTAQIATIEAGAWQFEPLPHASSYLDGSMGEGYGWAGGADASLSTRTAARLGIPTRILDAQVGGFAMWWRPNDGAAFGRDRMLLALPLGSEAITLRHDGASNVIRLSTPNESGFATIEADAPTFVGGDDLLIAASWDSEALALSVDGSVWARAPRGALMGATTGSRAEVGSAGADALEANGVVGPFWCWDQPFFPDRAQRLWNAARTLRPSEL